MPSTGSGWPTYYMQEHYAFVTGHAGDVASLVFEGVFERFPTLKVVLIEARLRLGAGAALAHGQALASACATKCRISSARRPNMCASISGSRPSRSRSRSDPQHLADMIDWIGWDRLLFSTDYPHWDFDDPRYAFKIKLTRARSGR